MKILATRLNGKSGRFFFHWGASRRSVVTLFASGAVAQGLVMLAYPILTRLYTPEQMGELAAIAAAVMILVPMFALRYEAALLIAPSDEEAGNLLALCLLIMAAMGTFMTAGLLAYAAWTENPWQPAARHGLFLPLGLAGLCGYTLVVNEAIRLSRFGEIARTRLYQAVTGPAVQIGLGALGAGTPGLLVGFVAGACSGTLGLGYRLLGGPASPLRRARLPGIIAAATAYRRFALFSSWSTVVHNAATDLMPLGCTLLFGPATGGFVFFGDRVLGRPLQVLGLAFQQVYDGEAGKAVRRDPATLRGLFLRVVAKQAVAGALWLGAIFLLAGILVPVVFGGDWAAAVPYVRALLLGHFATLVADPVHHTLMLIGRQKLSAGLSLTLFAMVGGVLVGSWSLGASALDAVLACSLARACGNGAILLVTHAILSRMRGSAVPED